MRRCDQCGADLPSGASPARKYCSADCRWKAGSKPRYAALSPAERAAYIARVRARQLGRAGQAG